MNENIVILITFIDLHLIRLMVFYLIEQCSTPISPLTPPTSDLSLHLCQHFSLMKYHS